MAPIGSPAAPAGSAGGYGSVDGPGSTAPKPASPFEHAASPPGPQLKSVSEEETLGQMEMGKRPPTGEAAGPQLTYSGSGLSALSASQAAAAAAPPPKPTFKERAHEAWQSANYIWFGLPTACKATLLVAVVNFVLSVVYASVSLTLPDVDEEVHITITIVISAVFVLYTVADAIVYENTLELATSIIMDTLVLARVMWFAAQKSEQQSFTIAWCTAMGVCQCVYIVVATMAWREFGWRLYGKLGVDFREKGADKKMRVALQRNAYVTLLKINGMLMVVLSAIGVDVSVEKRGGHPYIPLLVVSLCGFFIGVSAIWLAVQAVVKTAVKGSRRKMLWLFHATMPLVIGYPVALIILYNLGPQDMANANISLNVSGGAYIVTSLLMWWCTHVMFRLAHKKSPAEQSSDAVLSSRSNALATGDPVLAAMHAGAWLGKPTQRSPNKIRFFQLSHDGSTLRWGWNKFVRLYYVEEMYHSDEDLTLTLTFPFEAELVLKCPDSATYYAWRRGLAHLLLLIMAPGSPLHPGDKAQPPQTSGGTAGSRGGTPVLTSWVTIGRTTSKGMIEAAVAASGELLQPEDSGLSMLRQLGVRVQEIGRRVAPKRWITPQMSAASAFSTSRRRAGSGEGEGSQHGLDATAGGGASGGLSVGDSEERPGAATPPQQQQQQQQQPRRQEDSSVQLAKRQRMAAYLQTLAAASHPAVALQPAAAAAAAVRARSRRPRIRISEDSNTALEPSRPQFVSVGVQTDESDLQRTAASAAGASGVRAGGTAAADGQRGGSGSSGSGSGGGGSGSSGSGGGGSGNGYPPDAAWRSSFGVEPGTPRTSVGLPMGAPRSDDSGIAAQYMAAMQAAVVGAGPGGSSTCPAAAPQVDSSTNGDADVAAQYMAAIAGAAAGAGGRGQQSGAQQPAAEQQQGMQMQADPSTDGGIAAQYMAAMAAAAGGGRGVDEPAGPAPPSAPLAQQAQQQGAAPAGSDADLAAQYMGAMAAATTAQQAQQAQQGVQPAGSDADLAAQYMGAMAAAQQAQQQAQQQGQQQQAQQGLGAGFAGPPSATYQQRQQDQGQEERTPVARSQGPASGRMSRLSLSPEGASPLEQLAYQQLQRSLHRSRSVHQPQSPASPLEQLAIIRASARGGGKGGGTPGSVTPVRSPSMPGGGGGLWQLATAVDVIDIEELSFGKMLGAGAEGAVYAAWFLESPVAVKKFERAEDSLHEVEMYLQAGSHDNVVALRGLCQHEGSMYLVLEYCPRGTLDALLHHSAKNQWDPLKLLALIRSIARGMHYLHSRNVLHRDLKPANIFVGHGQMMKIGDFGMARIMAPTSGECGAGGPPNLRRLTPGTVGTVQYSAPELINEDLRPQGVLDGDWSLKLDVWSFGVTLWEILERRRPFEGLSQNAVQARWMSDPYAARLPPVRLPETPDRNGKRIFRGLSDLVEDCTRLDPYARPSFRDVLLRLKSLAAFAERGREVM